MKLRKLTTFREARGDFLAQVPGEKRQQNYASTVAYIAEVLLARMETLGLCREPVQAESEVRPARGGALLAGAGQQCPECHALTLHKVGGCQECTSCGYVGSCG
jgi:ribonucleoside-diphosphate reductase alpha chain